MDYSKIIQEIKAKQFHPIYFLCGEEGFFIDQISDLIEQTALEDHEKEFNQTVVYGIDTDIANIVSAAKRFPMMASYNVVIVKEAQNLKKWDDLIPYLEQPSNETILVLNHKYKKPDSRTKFGKLIKKSSLYFDSKKPYDDQFPKWIENGIQSRGFKIEPKAVMLLFDSIGANLSKLHNEIEKLVINLNAGETITPDIIESNIGISKDFNVFELNAALGKKDVVKANRIINYFGQNEKEFPLPALLPMMYRFFNQLLLFHTVKNESPKVQASTLGVNPYFLGDFKIAFKNYPVKKIARIMGYLRDTDRYSKGIGDSSSSNSDLLKELIFKIMH